MTVPTPAPPPAPAGAPALPWRDTPLRYGRITRLLHWTIAAMILWQLLGMGLKLALGRHPVAGFFVGSHQPVGTAVFVLIVVRLLWAAANSRRRPDYEPGTLGLAARVGHLLLYLVMLAVPALGLLRAWVSERAFAPFGWTLFPAQQPPVDWAVRLAGALHGELGWVLAALIAGHVLMVGVHQAMWRDGTLARMIGRGAR